MTSTRDRRLRLGIATLLAAAITLTACDGDGSDADTAPTSETAATSPTQAELRSALLTLDDLPTGWSSIPYDTESGDNVCPAEVAGPLGLDAEPPSVGVQYAANQLQGPSFAEAIQVVPPGRGPELMPIVEAAVAACDGQVYDGRTAQVTELSLPALGSESAAYTVDLGGIPIHLLYVVSGDIAIVMSTYDLTGGDPVELLEEYGPRAVDKATDALS